MTEQVQAVCADDLMEADVTAVIDACGGDSRVAIKALLIEQHMPDHLHRSISCPG